MCGRFTLSSPAELVADEFDLAEPPRLTPRYNIAPSQLIAVVALRDGSARGLAMLKWGLVPHWSASPASAPRPINMRAETVASKFADHFHDKRRLIVADGFFEWRSVGGKKYPHHFHLADRRPFAFAGLFDLWRGEGGERVASCGFITSAPNELVAPVHDRMPAIVPRDRYAEWLDPDADEAALRSLLRPYPAEAMRAVEVGTSVNSPRNDGPECLTPA